MIDFHYIDESGFVARCCGKRVGLQTAGKAEIWQRIGVREETPAVASTRGIYLGSRLLGNKYWPYGMKANHKELELVMRYTHEQGLAKRRLKVDEVFHPSTLNLIER